MNNNFKSQWNISIEFNAQDKVYVVTDRRGTKSFIRDHKKAEATYSRLVNKVEESIGLGLYDTAKCRR